MVDENIKYWQDEIISLENYIITLENDLDEIEDSWDREIIQENINDVIREIMSFQYEIDKYILNKNNS